MSCTTTFNKCRGSPSIQFVLRSSSPGQENDSPNFYEMKMLGIKGNLIRSPRDKAEKLYFYYIFKTRNDKFQNPASSGKDKTKRTRIRNQRISSAAEIKKEPLIQTDSATGIEINQSRLHFFLKSHAALLETGESRWCAADDKMIQHVNIQ